MSNDGQASLETLRELVQIRYLQKNWQLWKARTPELTHALRGLDPFSAHALVGELWAQYDHDDIAYLLGQFNASVPGALADWTDEFVAQGFIVPGWLYLGAPASTTGRLLEVFDHPEFSKMRNGLLLALTWIGDENVRNQFREWRENSPPWRSHLHIAPHEYAVRAGWELTSDGGRRDLYYETCYALVPADEPECAPSIYPVAISTPVEATCGWCGRKLASLLDFDLSDPRCAFILKDATVTSTVATRLHVAYCLWCSYYATLYTDVNLDGGVRWSDENETMPRILDQVGVGSDDDLPPPATCRLVLGSRRRTPYEVLGRFMLSETGISQIGGHPEWIQDAKYPVCPACRQRMLYIGQVSWEDIEEFAEGSTYAFLCLPCGKAATIYQQT